MGAMGTMGAYQFRATIIEQKDNYTATVTAELSNEDIETGRATMNHLSPEAWLLLTSSKKTGRKREEAKLDLLW
jgi:hypothetical protein